MLKFVWHDVKNSKHSCLLLLCRRWHTCTMLRGCISSLRSFIPESFAARKVFEFRVFFWSVSFSIQTAYGDLSPYSVRIWEKTDPKNSEFGIFLTVLFLSIFQRVLKGVLSNFIFHYVLVPPSIISSNESLLFTKQENSVVHIGANVRSRIGSSFQLICKAYGIPRPEIMWIKKNTGGKEIMKIKVSPF